MNEVDLGNPHRSLTTFFFGCTQRVCQTSKDIVDNLGNMFESRISAGAKEKLLYSGNLTPRTEGHTKKCVERCSELANKTTQQLYKVATPCLDDHQFKEEELGFVGELSNVCSLVFGTHWYTRHFMVCEQICPCCHQMDQSR